MTSGNIKRYNYHNITEECFNCWTFKENAENGYMCAVKGYCPGLDLSEKNKERIFKAKESYMNKIKDLPININRTNSKS